MNLTRCNNGHFYDSDKFSNCPHCSNIPDARVLTPPQPIIPEPDKPILYKLNLIKKGFHEDKEIFIQGNSIGVGKEPNLCNILLESIYGSRLHAKFVYDNGCWSIIDTDSTNGTRVNGNQIIPNKPYKLNNDDEIAFSPVDIYIFVDTKEDNDIVYCHNCGRKIINHNNGLPLICGYCNEKQDIVDKETTTLICEDCYECNLVTDNFCRHCGKPLKESVTKKSDYYICVYTKTENKYFGQSVSGIQVFENCQMTNASVRVNTYGEGILFALVPEKKNELKITNIYTSGQYSFFRGYHKESIVQSFELNKSQDFEFYFGFGRPEKHSLFYVISKKPITPKDVIGDYIEQSSGVYISKLEFLNCLKKTKKDISKFIEQLNSSKEDFKFIDFDELIYGRVEPLAPNLLIEDD